MSQPIPQSDLSNSQNSNQLISYSRLADQIDQQQKDSAYQQNMKASNDLFFQINSPTSFKHKITNSNKRQDNQITEDRNNLIRSYPNQIQRQDIKNNNLNGLIQPQQNIKKITKQIKFQHHQQKLHILNSKLGAISQNQNQNKRSDELEGQHQTFLQSKIYNQIKINSLPGINKPSDPPAMSITNQKSVTFQKYDGNKDFAVRYIEQSVELDKNQIQKIENVEMVKPIKIQPIKVSKNKKEEDKVIVSSQTTITKLLNKPNQIKNIEQLPKKSEEEIWKRIQKQIIQIKQKLDSKNKNLSQNKSSKRFIFDEQSNKDKRKKYRSISNKIQPHIHKKQFQFQNNYFKKQKSIKIFSQPQLAYLLKNKLWDNLINPTQQKQKIYRILDKIAQYFQFTHNYSIKKIQPLTVIFDSQILQVSYSQKIYIGQFKIECRNYIKNGLGIQINPNSSIYRGFYLDGSKNGKGLMIFNKRYIYQGEWSNGLMSGQGILRQFTGDVYIGDFLNGKKSGNGRQQFSNGDRYQGQYFNDQFHGKGCYKWKNGSIYQGQFYNNQMHGTGLWVSHNGDKYHGDFARNHKEGYGIYSYKNGNVYKGQFSKGSPKNIESKKSIRDRQFKNQKIIQRYTIHYKN